MIKKKIIANKLAAGAIAAVLSCSAGGTLAFAADVTTAAPGVPVTQQQHHAAPNAPATAPHHAMPNAAPNTTPNRINRAHRNLSDAQRRVLQEIRAQYKQKQEAFLNSLNPQQKAAYSELMQIRRNMTSIRRGQ